MNIITPIDAPCAWHGRYMAQSQRWVRELKPTHIDELDRALSNVERRGIAWHVIAPSDFPLPGLAGLIDEIRTELEDGSGLMKLKGLPEDHKVLWGNIEAGAMRGGIGQTAAT